MQYNNLNLERDILIHQIESIKKKYINILKYKNLNSNLIFN